MKRKKRIALFVGLVVISVAILIIAGSRILYFYDGGILIKPLLVSRGVVFEPQKISTLENLDTLLNSVKLADLQTCGSKSLKRVMNFQAHIWSPNAELIEVFPIAFSVSHQKAQSLLWTFVYKDFEKSKVLYILGTKDKILQIAGQIKSIENPLFKLANIKNWSFDPAEYNWHLRVISVNGKNQPVWIQKKWESVNYLYYTGNFTDAQTGQPLKSEKVLLSDTEMARLMGIAPDFNFKYFPLILNSDGKNVNKNIILEVLVIDNGFLNDYSGNRASLLNDANQKVSDGVLIAHFLNNILTIVYYENGERAFITDYFDVLNESK